MQVDTGVDSNIFSGNDIAAFNHPFSTKYFLQEISFLLDNTPVGKIIAHTLLLICKQRDTNAKLHVYLSGKFLVISLDTGTTKLNGGFDILVSGFNSSTSGNINR